jgi:hypothetical protein
VKANTGTAVPAGDVSLIATFPDGTTQGFDHFTLTSGAISGANTQSLPGGAYNVVAHYAGDGTNAPSDSSPVSVTVGQEGSQTFIVVPAFDSQTGMINGNASSLVYGSRYIIRMYVTNSAAALNPSGPPSPLCAGVNQITCPTGTVTLTDNGTPLDGGTFALNNAGYTRDLHPFLTGGTHQLSAHYGGDNSYNASTSAPDAITITPAPTNASMFGAFQPLVGQNFQLNVTVNMNVPGGKTPTGTFTFYDGGAPLAGTLTVAGYGDNPGNPSFQGFYETSLSTVGQHSITATYSGDANYASSTTAPVLITAQYQVTVNVTVDSNNIQYGTPVTATVTVVSNHTTPALVGNLNITGSFTPINGNVTTTLTTDGSGNQILKATVATTPLSSESINAGYFNDPNYANSSNSVFVNVIIPDFGLNIPATPFNITAGQPGTLQISVVPATNNSSPVTLLCNGNMPVGYSCSLQPATVNLAGGATSTATLTLSPSLSGAAAPMPNAITRKRVGVFFFPFGSNPLWPISLLSGLAAALALSSTWKRRELRLSAGFGLICIISLIIGCGGGSSTGPPPPPIAGPFATSTTVSTSSAKVAQGAPLTFTARVTGQGSPAGNVAFYTNGSWIGASTLAAGTATLNTTLPFPGIYSITAQYAGDSNNLTSASPGVGESVTGSTVMQVNGQTSTLFHSANVTVTIQ